MEWRSPGGEGGSLGVLPGRLHVAHGEVLRDLVHVLVEEQGVEAVLV